MTFSAVTWNVLAQAYVKPGRYDHVPPSALEPARRRALTLDTIAALDADLYCLQEVEPDAFDAIGARLGDAYDGRYAQKRGRPDGSAIFARREALTIQSAEPLRYAACEPGYDHLALICALTQGDREILVASTHLRWQRRDTPRREHLGLKQLSELLDRMADAPAKLVCGDLNALSQSAVIDEALDRGLRLSCRSQRPWDTTNIDGRRRKLDYLLYTPATLDPAPGRLPRLERRDPMPSAVYASDHLPVKVRYTWR